jgi:hypothetical protein
MDDDASDLPVIPVRGRARSQSFHSGVQPDFGAEISALTGSTTVESKSGSTVPPTDLSSRAGAAKAPLSRKTISMLTDLTAAVAPELDVADRALSEEELAEKQLAEEDRIRRTAEQMPGSASSSVQPTALSMPAASKASIAASGLRSKLRGVEGEHDILVKLLLLGDGGVGKLNSSPRVARWRHRRLQHSGLCSSRYASAAQAKRR